ncbi:MAG: 30S ribosomal protein S6 [Clostridiaceae bacterium]|nr:30S ribosomal protein S6 [Clostridiaceae bacterium]
MTGPFSPGGGEKVARKYEVVYILNPALGEEAVNAIVERIQALIESSATIDQVDVWGRRRLAYEIDDQKEGFYVLVNFSAEGEFPKELERVLRITEGVLRYMVIRTDD